MQNCKRCGEELTDAAASASIFALSFLPVQGVRVDRRATTKLAEQIGPLCLDCLEQYKDLAEAGNS
jgi:hypothetical protein